MKKLILFSAVAMMLLAGCSKNEVVQTPDQLITFCAPVIGSMTKAPVTGNIEDIYPTGEKFKVWAQYSADNLTAWENGQTYMSAVTCVYNSNKNGWIPEGNQYYWPKNGKLSFAAFSPADVAGVTYDQTGVTVTNYTVSNAEEHIDLLYSHRAYNKTATNQDDAPGTPSYTGVDINFHHALTSVKFKVKQAAEYAGTTLKLKKIQLNYVYKKGDFKEKITTQTGGTDDDGCTRKPEWSNHAGETSYMVIDNSNQTLTTTATDVTDANDMLLIGQKYNHDTKYISMTVVYTIDSPTGDPIEQVCNVEFKNLKHKDEKGNEVAGIQDGWYPGYEYTYIISIGLNGEIQFEPIVYEWTPILADPDIEL